MTTKKRFIIGICCAAIFLFVAFMYGLNRSMDTDKVSDKITAEVKIPEVRVEKVKKQQDAKIYLAGRSGILSAKKSVKMAFDSSGQLIYVLPDLSYVKKGDLIATVGFPSVGDTYKKFRSVESDLINFVYTFLKEAKSFDYILPKDRMARYENEADELINVFEQHERKLGIEMKSSGYPTLIRSYIAYKKAWDSFEPDLILCIDGVISVSDFNNSFSTFQDTATGLNQLLYDRSLYAPLNGYLVYNNDEGDLNRDDYVDKGTKLFEVIDLSSLRMKIKIPEKDIQYVKKGTLAKVAVVPSFAGRAFNGYVSKTGLKVDATTRELEVEVAFDNPNVVDSQGGPGLLPGMSAEVQLVKEVISEAYVIPKSAVNDFGSDSVVIGTVYDNIFSNINIKKKYLLKIGTDYYYLNLRQVGFLPDYIVVPYKHLANGEKVIAVEGGK